MENTLRVYDDLTGETERYRRIYSGKSFWKLYMDEFLEILRAFDDKRLNILAYILKNTHPSTNRFSGTYRSISNACDVSLSTVTQVMKLLRDKKFIKKLQNGTYIISPNVLMKGDDRKMGRILREFLSCTNETPASADADTNRDVHAEDKG